MLQRLSDRGGSRGDSARPLKESSSFWVLPGKLWMREVVFLSSFLPIDGVCRAGFEDSFP